MTKARRCPPLLALLLTGAACSPMPGQASAPVDSGAPAAAAATVSSIALPGGEGGIGFDDLRWSARLGRVLVPGGRTGKLFLVDPASGAVQSLAGFSATSDFAGGHGDGTTSVDDGDGLLYAIDRTSRTLLVLDAELHVASQVALGGGPDSVRWVGPTRELWVTEPGAEAIEVFTAGADARQAPERVAVIAVPGGDAGTLTVLGVGADGALTRLGTIAASEGCHSVVTDGAGHVFVGDPDDGRLLVFSDTYPSSLPSAR